DPASGAGQRSGEGTGRIRQDSRDASVATGRGRSSSYRSGKRQSVPGTLSQHGGFSQRESIRRGVRVAFGQSDGLGQLRAGAGRPISRSRNAASASAARSTRDRAAGSGTAGRRLTGNDARGRRAGRAAGHQRAVLRGASRSDGGERLQAGEA